MNNLKAINARNFVMTLMILAGVCSCNKEEIEQQRTGKVTVINHNQNKIGDDDDEAILQGGISYSDGESVVNAIVHLYISGTTIPFKTTISDSNGEFKITVPHETYFIEVIEINSNSTKTNEFTVTKNANLKVVI